MKKFILLLILFNVFTFAQEASTGNILEDHDNAVEGILSDEIKKQKLDCLMICVTNTPVALNVAKKIKQQLDTNTLVIDLTTHNKNGALKMDKIFKSTPFSFA